MLLLPVQTPGFGSFAKDTPPEVLVPARMTYSGTTGSQQQVYVCDPAHDKWNPGPAEAGLGGLVQCYSEPYWSQSEGTWYQWCYTDELCYDHSGPDDRTISNRIDGCDASCKTRYHTSDCYEEDYPWWCWCKAQPMWTAAEPTGCFAACDAGSGTPGAVTCSTGNDADCDASAKPPAKQCPGTCGEDASSYKCNPDYPGATDCVCGQTGDTVIGELFVCLGGTTCCDGYGTDGDHDYAAIVKCSNSGCNGPRRRNNGVVETTGWDSYPMIFCERSGKC